MTVLEKKLKESNLLKFLPPKNNSNYKTYKSILKVMQGVTELQTEFENRKKGNALKGIVIALADVFRENQENILNILNVPTIHDRRREARPIIPVTFKDPNPTKTNKILIDDGCDGCTQTKKDVESGKITFKKTNNTSGSTVKPEYRKKNVKQERTHPNQEGLKRGKVREVITQLPNEGQKAIPNDNTPIEEMIDFENATINDWNDVYHIMSGDKNKMFNYCMVMSITEAKIAMSEKDLCKLIYLMLQHEELI